MEELLQHDLEEARYYLNMPNLIIMLPITDIAASEDGITLTLGEDNTSSITIWREASEVKRVRRPTGIIGEFEWCYLIKNEDLVSFITDWREHNLIRADRKTNSIYKDLLLKVLPKVELIEPKKELI